MLKSLNLGLKIYSSIKYKNLINENLDLISWIVKAEDAEFLDKKPKDENLAFWVIKAWIEIYIDTSNALDLDKEIERLTLQIADTKEYISILDKKLLNENFVNKAPESLVRAEIEKKDKAKEKLQKLQEKLDSLKK